MSFLTTLKPYYEDMLGWSLENPRMATGILAVSLAAVYYIQRRLTAPRYPPGPTAWPVIGSIPSLSEKMHLDIMRFREQYGDVFTIWVGSK